MSFASELAVGSELPALEKVVYQRALERRTFSHDSSHDDDNARRFGYPGALVSAYVLAGLMSEPLVRAFGAAWFTAGSISLTFVGRGVQQGDHVTVAGVVTEIASEGDRRRVTLDVWMVKAGVRAVVGSASCTTELS